MLTFYPPGLVAGALTAAPRAHVVAVAELTHRFLPGMIERRWGRIINVASGRDAARGCRAHPVRRRQGVRDHVLGVARPRDRSPRTPRYGELPGFTLSEFHDVTGTRTQVSTMPYYMWLDADFVAGASYDAVMAGVPVFVPGRLNATLAVAGRMLPRKLVSRLMQRNAGKFRRV